VCSKFKEWLAVKKKKTDELAREYAKAFGFLFKKHQKALAVIGTEQFLQWLSAEKVTPKTFALESIKWFGHFWVEELGRTLEGDLLPVASVEETAPASASVTEDVIADMQILNDNPAIDRHKEKKRKKEDRIEGKTKHRRTDHGTIIPGEAQPHSENGQIDFNAAMWPPSILVKASTSSKLDGRYEMLPEAKSNRPSYLKKGKEGKKDMYLYWNKRWRIGTEYGSSKCNSQIDEVSPHLLPCEPYPHSWRLFQKPEGKHGEGGDAEKRVLQIIPGMRLIAELAETSKLEDIGIPILDEYQKVGGESKRKRSLNFVSKGVENVATPPSTSEGAQETQEQARKDTVAKRKTATSQNKGSVPAEEHKQDGGHAESKADKNKEDKEEDAEEEEEEEEKEEEDEEEEEEEEEEKEASSSSSSGEESDSDTSESSSSSASADEDAPSKKKAQTPASQSTNPSPNATPQRLSPKSIDFAAKLRLQLSKMHKDEIKKKLHSIKDAVQRDIRVWSNGVLAKHSAMSPDQFLQLLRELEQEYGEKASTGDTRTAGSHYGSAPDEPMAPRTPEQLLEEGEVNHRTAVPKRSALKRRGSGQNRNGYNRRNITYQLGNQLVQEVSVVSLRSHLHDLWFIQPGALVTCDNCGESVPQHGGSLTGAQGRSQFTQNSFLCHSCMAVIG